MNQYLITFCYLFTVILLFPAFFICRAVPTGQPINIDLYQNNTIISFAISDPSQIAYVVPEEFPFHADTPYPSILELEESTIEEQQQDQWEINTNNEIPGLGNFENTE